MNLKNKGFVKFYLRSHSLTVMPSILLISPIQQSQLMALERSEKSKYKLKFIFSDLF
jgi:hypothetical protein